MRGRRYGRGRARRFAIGSSRAKAAQSDPASAGKDTAAIGDARALPVTGIGLPIARRERIGESLPATRIGAGMVRTGCRGRIRYILATVANSLAIFPAAGPGTMPAVAGRPVQASDMRIARTHSRQRRLSVAQIIRYGILLVNPAC